MNYSRQREAVYSYLRSTTEHPTVDMIYNKIREDYLKISLATVYRNLQTLEDIGEVQRIPSNDSKDHFDARVDRHPHFICNKCKKVEDVIMDDIGFLNTLAKPQIQGDIEATQLIFFGTCNECKEK